MYLSHAVWSSLGLSALQEIYCLDKRNEKECTDVYGKSPNGSIYYGRGPLLVAHDYNYRSASLEIFGNEETLLNDPDRVYRNRSTGWLTAAVIWRSTVHFVSSTFGNTIKALRGVLFCDGGSLADLNGKLCDHYRGIQIILGDPLRDREYECSCSVNELLFALADKRNVDLMSQISLYRKLTGLATILMSRRILFNLGRKVIMRLSYMMILIIYKILHPLLKLTTRLGRTLY
jgi:hypothetical protein